MVLVNNHDARLGIASGPMVRRIEADSAGPGGWLLQGEQMAVAKGDIWAVIHRSLQADPSAASIKYGAITLSRRQVLEAVNDIPWEPHYCRVGLHLPRSLESVILTLAIWKNGGIYVPIAADYPLARVKAIADTCDLDLIIANQPLDLPKYSLAQTGGKSGFPLFFYVRNNHLESGPPDPGLCYIAHTSGSTGTPKGVKLSHANLLNRITSMQRFLGIGPQDRMLYKTSAVFDVHLWEFVLPLASGCLLIIYPQAKYFDLPEVAKIIVVDGVTVIGIVPALLRLLLEIPSFLDNNVLRAVLCGGEAWNASLAMDFHARMPRRKLYNSYGPTETAIAVANWPVPESVDLQQICLGNPLPNLVFLIEEGTPDSAVLDGQIVGQLSIGGMQVALGYVDERGKNRFFDRMINGETVRFYRTGDLVRLDMTTGSLCFKGREDNQVKVNGVRIDLEEIEETICGVSGVESCVTFVVKSGQTSQLCAAYKTKCNIPIPPAEIKEACTRLLPAVLIPTRLQQVASFPLAENGKIDRMSLITGFNHAQK
jgi:amino acid adenylation domain-containing protein